jgi:8-oxo-dGTP diphosphatase
MTSPLLTLADMAKHNSDRDLIARAIIWKNDCLLVNGNTNKKTSERYVALPGGHVDPGESCVQALQREIEEELAAKCSVGDLVFASENIYAGRELNEKKRHELTLVWSASISGEKTNADGTIESPEEWKNFHWLPKSQLESANLLPATMKEFLILSAFGEEEEVAGELPRYAFADSRDVEAKKTKK